MVLVDVEVCEDEFNDLVWRREEGVQQAVEPRRVRARVVWAAERAALLAVSRCEPNTRATWGQYKSQSRLCH